MGSARAVFEYHLTGYRRTWRGSALSSFLLPLLTVLGFGVGVGAYVDRGVGGVPYLHWLVPGLIASTALQVAVGGSTWPVFAGFEWTRTYFAQAAAPLRIVDILGGQLAFVVFRTVLSTAVFLLVAAAFGTMCSGWALATLPLAVLIGVAAAAPTIAYTASIRSDSYLALLIRLAVIPMSLFSGVFFPMETLPVVLRWVAYVVPLWHGVELSRAATLGTGPAWPWGGHALCLVGWAAAGWGLAYVRFRDRLVV